MVGRGRGSNASALRGESERSGMCLKRRRDWDGDEVDGYSDVSEDDGGGAAGNDTETAGNTGQSVEIDLGGDGADAVAGGSDDGDAGEEEDGERSVFSDGDAEYVEDEEEWWHAGWDSDTQSV